MGFEATQMFPSKHLQQGLYSHISFGHTYKQATSYFLHYVQGCMNYDETKAKTMKNQIQSVI